MIYSNQKINHDIKTLFRKDNMKITSEVSEKSILHCEYSVSRFDKFNRQIVV